MQKREEKKKKKLNISEPWQCKVQKMPIDGEENKMHKLESNA
jgi:hypothetical protein